MRTDERNFSAIVHEYEKPLYFHIRRMVVSHDDASDILQNTFIKAYTKLWLLRSEDGLRPWLYRIATNEALDFLRKSGRSEGLDEKLQEQIAGGENVDYINDAEINLQKVLVSLPEKQRLVFSLRYYDEMDYDEISKITGMSIDTLKVNYHYAKDKVKKYILDNS